MSEQELPALLDVNQLAFQLGLCERTIEKRTKAGCVPGFVRVFDHHPRWRRDVILQWIEAGCPDIRGIEAQGGAIDLNGR